MRALAFLLIGKLWHRAQWCRNKQGTTAIEFALVAAPFFFFAFSIMGIGLQFFTINALEHGVETAARQIRTGQMQNGKMVDGAKVDYTLAEFKALVCEQAGLFIQDDCESKLIVHIDSGGGWQDVSATPCLDDSGNLKAATGNATDSITTQTGGANQVVLVNVCYDWELGGRMWNSLWKLLVSEPWKTDGSELSTNHGDKVIIQSIATFRTEPYS